jgi:acetyl esterase
VALHDAVSNKGKQGDDWNGDRTRMSWETGQSDPEVVDFIAASDATFTPAFDALPIAEQRALYDRFWQRFDAPRPDGVTVEEVRLPGPGGSLRALLYRPEGAAGPVPVVAYFHGGGWTLGSPESHDIATSRLCAQTGSAVLSLDYRLAPEHVFPAALMDCHASLDWLVREGPRLGLDPGRLAVAGDSAGGNLAAALCLWVRDHGGPKISFQGLIYPALRCSVAPGNSGGVSPEAVSQYLRAYFGGQDLCDDPYAMPLSAKSFANLPPAYIATASLDPLLPHGESFAQRLRHAGIPCDYSCGSGLPHTYLRTLHLSRRAAAEFAALCAAAKRALAPNTVVAL